MKAILITSVAGMISAGIYGLADFASDYKNNKLIKYDDGKEAPIVKKENHAPRIMLTRNEDAVVNKPAPEKPKVSETPKVVQPVMKMEYFSRGEPNFTLEDITKEETVRKDSASVEEQKQVLPEKDSVTAPKVERTPEKVKTDTATRVGLMEDKPKISFRSFSRAPLGNYKRKEAAAVARNDSAKMKQ